MSVMATASDRPILSTIPSIEILAVGSWDAHTPDGQPARVTAEDLVAMVAAARDGHVRPAIVKLGHDSTLNDGAPALGRVENLRVSEDGMTLLGDLVGVPTWLADIAASAYPRRSAEWYQNYTTDTGRKFDSVLTAVSLLGEAYPAVETLEDIQALFAATAPELVPVKAGATHEAVITATKGEPMSQPVKARVDVDEVCRSFYDASGDWSWIREVYIDPPELIIDDDNGNLFRLPYTVTGDTVQFGDRTSVRVDYIDQKKAAAEGRQRVLVFASKAASRPSTPKENPMDDQVRVFLEAQGVDPAQATEDQINAASVFVAAGIDPPKAKADDVPEVEKTDDTKVQEPVATTDDEKADVPEPIAAKAQVDDALEKRLAAAEGKLAQRDENDTKSRRDTVIAAAITDGRLTPAERDEYRGLIDLDEDRITRILAARPVVVPLGERGVAASDDTSVQGSALSDSPLLNQRERQALLARGL